MEKESCCSWRGNREINVNFDAACKGSSPSECISPLLPPYKNCNTTAMALSRSRVSMVTKRIYIRLWPHVTCFSLINVTWSCGMLQLILILYYGVRARGSIVVKALRYKPEGRGSESRWGHWIFFSIYLNVPALLRPEVDSASNRNGCQTEKNVSGDYSVAGA
jgi:hypothetical protein